jgi:hypothetical protein
MKPETKTFATIFGYCAILWMTNWSLSHEYARQFGVTASSLDMRGFGALLGLGASLVLARRIWRVARILFDARVRIPSSIRLWGSWSYLWLLLPLAFGTLHHSSGTAEDGARIDTVFEYGGSWAVPLFSGIAIMLFQLLSRLEAFNPENEEAEQAAPQQRCISIPISFL